MKKERCNRMFLILMSLMVGMLLFSGTASATIYYNEDFESETAGTNPSSSWYTYSENDVFDINNVTTNSSYADSQGFLLYDGDRADDAYALFTIDTITYYDTFTFFLNVSRSNHDQLNISFNDSSGQELGRIDISTDKLFFNNTGSKLYDTTIGNNDWYRIVIDFNLTTDRIGIYVYNMSNAGALVGSGWGDMEDGAGTYSNVATIKFWGAGDDRTNWVCIDELSLAYTYINPNQATNDLILATIITVFTVAILVSIITVAFSGNITPESLIMLAVVVIIGVVTIMVVNGLL